MANKVKYGLKNVTVFPIVEDTKEQITYATGFKIPGAVNLSLSAEGDSEDFYADDGIYFAMFANNGYSGDLEIALVPEEFYTKILGMTLDDNGVLIENAEDVGTEYAIAFEFSGDKNKTRHIMYKCSSSRPSVEGETIAGKKTPKTETISIKAYQRVSDGQIKAKVNADQVPYATFFDAPYTPQITAV